MDTYDLAHKLAYAGRRSPVAFDTGPQFTNSVPGVPVLAALRVFIAPDDWSHDNVLRAAREICRVLGAESEFDIGLTVDGTQVYQADRAAAGNVARLTKLDPGSNSVTLRYRGAEGDMAYSATFPRLSFEKAGEDFWRTTYSTGVVKPSTEQ